MSDAHLEPVIASDDAEKWPTSDQFRFEEGLDQFFDKLFEKAAKGEISYDQVERLFPREVIERSRNA